MSWMETHGFVYVLWDGTAFKIGETGGCVCDRIKTLQAGNPRHLQFMHCYETPDRKECEKYLHEQLRDYRCNGGVEWFDCCLEDIEQAAEEIESMFGAVKADPFKLERVEGTFTREIIDYWVMGDTLTLQLDHVDGDPRDLNFTVRSKCKRSRIAGQELLKKLQKCLGVGSYEELMHELRNLPLMIRPKLTITYKRKRSLWLNLNDFEVLEVKKHKQEYAI